MPMRQELELAQELIKEKNFDKARLLLSKVKDDPTAQKWLDQLEKIAPVKVAGSAETNGGVVAEPWQYMALEVKRSYGIQYKINGDNKPEWKDQPIFFPLNELGKEGWELVGFESIAEFSTYLLKKPGVGENKKIEVWDQ